MITIACYSIGTPYEAEAAVLRASLDRVGMRHHIEGFPDRGGWFANTAYKADFIRRLRDAVSGPMLYVDVDAFVHENCAAYFDSLAADFGVHFFAGPAFGHNRSKVCPCVHGGSCDRPHRLLSGTLFFGDTLAARTLLEMWVALNEGRRKLGKIDGGGQRNLWETWDCLRRMLRTVRLPGRYCYVFDKPWAYPAGEPCIIEHTIASRDHRPHDNGREKRPDEKNAARTERNIELAKLVGL
jgi:hypothetical protein